MFSENVNRMSRKRKKKEEDEDEEKAAAEVKAFQYTRHTVFDSKFDSS